MPEHPNGSWDWGPFHAGDYDMGDGQCVQWAQEFLAHEHEKPFFLAVGLFQPHLPFYAPEKYFEQYPRDKVFLPPSPLDDLLDLPPAAAEVCEAGQDKNHQMVVDSGEMRAAVQAYLACIAHADTLIGGLLDTLDAQGLADNTIIILWSDHGYHFGEKQRTAKRSLWERATRVPFIVVAPGITLPMQRCSQPVDLMSVYPTLLQLCGLPPNAANEGISVVPLLREPEATWEHVALTTHTENNHAIRTDRWRYIRYANGDEELYDLNHDPNEWDNLATRPEFARLKQELAAQLSRATKETLPW
jgi:arylsulfatase A-like enzyme